MNRSEKNGQGTTKTNRLIHEKSPYLLQHAHNPVDGHPRGTASSGLHWIFGSVHRLKD